MAWSKELESAASAGYPVPEGLTAAEQTLYIAIRGLYWQAQNEVVSLDQARKERNKLIKDFEKFDLLVKAQERALKAWRWLDLSIKEGDCPRCIEMKRTILQLENYF